MVSDSVRCQKERTKYFMMNINFPVDSESTETGGREGDGRGLWSALLPYYGEW